MKKDELIDKINDIFNQQIKTDERFKIDKTLFKLTSNFSMNDWKVIRTDKYWSIIDALPYEKKNEYTLKCVKYYIKYLRNEK